MKETRERIK